jgi:hypothetical protein
MVNVILDDLMRLAGGRAGANKKTAGRGTGGT